MSNKKFSNQYRLTSLERRASLQRNESMKTADRSSVNAGKRHIIWCRTFDDGFYPPSPGSGSQGEHVLPIIFDDVEYPLIPGPAGIIRTPLDTQRMDYALCRQWYPPGTAIPVFHQNRRWYESTAGSTTSLQPILWAFAKITTINNCLDPMSVDNLDYRPFGIFQLPWDAVITPGAISWASGEAAKWSSGENATWAASSGTFTVDNPLRLCGAVGDLVLLTYQGETKPPLVVEVIHKCYDIQVLEYDPAQCLLGYKNRSVCTPVTAEPTAGPPQPLIDFENQTFVTDVGYDPQTCELYNVYQDFCVIGTGSTPQVLAFLNLQDVQDPCCPCPTCPTNCSGCPDQYNITVQNWSTPDCGCMTITTPGRPLTRRAPPNGCAWDSNPTAICNVGSFLATIECVNNRWRLTINYNTSGTNDNVYVSSDPIDLGSAANACPKTGTYTPVWNYQGGSHVCTSNATQVVIA